MRKHTKKGAAVVAALGLALAVSAPAHATVYKSGTKSCGPTQIGKAEAYSTGFTEIYPPGGTKIHSWDNFSSWRTRSALSSKTKGGFWFVETNGSLNNSKTFASCVASGTP